MAPAEARGERPGRRHLAALQPTTIYLIAACAIPTRASSYFYSYFCLILSLQRTTAHGTSPRWPERGWAARWRGRFIPHTSPYTGRPTPPLARHHVHPVPLQSLLLPAVRRAQPMRHGSRPPARKLLVHDPAHRACRPGGRTRGTARQGLHLPGLRHALQQRSATLCTPSRACVDMISAFCGNTP